jgi:hypothetical protein
MPLSKIRRRMSSWLVAAFAALLTIATTGLASAPAADAATYWGGTISGSVYGLTGDAPWNQTVQGRFEANAGKHITMVNTGQQWASFDAATMKEALAGGAIPLVTMGLQGQTLQEIASGRQDAQIRAWAQAAKAFGLPFLFRPWWEMNGEWFAWGRSPYFVAAWQHFHDIVEEVGATNVTWAWVPNTIWGDPGSNPAPYYPGSAYVDWVGMDAYNFGTNPLHEGSTWMTPSQLIGPTLAILNQIAPGKPVCICEIASTEIGGNKAAWITELLQSYLPSQPSIQAVLWFNYNIEADGGTYDWPIESSAGAQKAFHEGIQNPWYLSSMPSLTALTKLPLPNSVPTAASPAAASPSGAKSASAKSAGQQAKMTGTEIAFPLVRLNRRTGVAKLQLEVARAGVVTLSGQGIWSRVRWLNGGPWSAKTPLPVSHRLRKPGLIEMKVGATGAALKALRRTGTTKVVLRVKVKTLTGRQILGHKPLTLKLEAQP